MQGRQKYLLVFQYQARSQIWWQECEMQFKSLDTVVHQNSFFLDSLSRIFYMKQHVHFPLPRITASYLSTKFVSKSIPSLPSSVPHFPVSLGLANFSVLLFSAKTALLWGGLGEIFKSSSMPPVWISSFKNVPVRFWAPCDIVSARSPIFSVAFCARQEL